MPVQAIDSEAWLEELLAGPGAVLVDFTATWCGPCQKLAPVLEELAADYATRLNVVKVDIDEHAGLARRYEVQGVPTLILFEGGEPLARVVGAQPKRSLVELLDPLLP